MELEAIDALLRVDGAAAPAALALAQRRLDAWDAGGPAPDDIPREYRVRQTLNPHSACLPAWLLDDVFGGCFQTCGQVCKGVLVAF